MTERSQTARLIKKIVVGYKLPALPTFLMRSFILLRSKLARAGFHIEVALAPLNELPSEVDLLFVPRELLAEAQQLVPTDKVIPLITTTAQQAAYDELVAQLEAGKVLYAPPLVEVAPATSDGRVTVHYRGYTRLG